MCHLVLLLPVLSLPIFWLWPLSVAVPVYVVIVALSIGLYVLKFSVMRRPAQAGGEALLHQYGEIREVHGTFARVRVQGELWNAKTLEPVRCRDRVEIVNVDGLMLAVRRAPRRDPVRERSGLAAPP